MERDEVMPIVLSGHESGYARLVAQRDADWERVKPLVEAAQELAVNFPPIERRQDDERGWLFPAGSMMDSKFVLALIEALAQLGVEVKE